MSKRTLTLATCVVALLAAAGLRADDLCDLFFAEQLTCTLDPVSGLCEGSGPAIIGGVSYTLDLTRIDLGAPLDIAPDGTVRGVASEDLLIRETGVRVTTIGESTFRPTADPAVVAFVERADVVASNRRYDSGVLVASGEVDLSTGAATGNLVGKLCRTPHLN